MTIEIKDNIIVINDNGKTYYINKNSNIETSNSNNRKVNDNVTY